MLVCDKNLVDMMPGYLFNVNSLERVVLIKAALRFDTDLLQNGMEYYVLDWDPLVCLLLAFHPA